MKKRVLRIVPFFLIVLGFSSSLTASPLGFKSISGDVGTVAVNFSEVSEPVTDLFLQMMTRPGITAESDISALRPAARDAGLLFQLSLLQGRLGIPKWVQFRRDIGLLVKAYQVEYGLAPPGEAGADARGAAVDRLFDGLTSAAGRAGIQRDELAKAMLSGSASVETRLSALPLSNILTLADRELVKLLLQVGVDQARRSTFLDANRDALGLINAGTEFTTPYENRIYTISMNGLKTELVGLERFLADPLNIADQQNLLTARYNHEAQFDLYAMKYGMENCFLYLELQSTQLPLISGRIPGMTPELLQEQLDLSGGSTFTALAAFASIPSDLSLDYTQVNGLAERLTTLGEMVPTPPDFALFPNPYRSLLKMDYDILLCDKINNKELQIAQDNASNLSRPLTLGEQQALKVSAMQRTSSVRSHIAGVPPDTANALIILMQSSFDMRI